MALLHKQCQVLRTWGGGTRREMERLNRSHGGKKYLVGVYRIDKLNLLAVRSENSKICWTWSATVDHTYMKKEGHFLLWGILQNV